MTRREQLESLRERLTAALDTADARSLSAISRELRLVLLELEGLPVPGRVTTRDEITAARAKRAAKVG